MFVLTLTQRDAADAGDRVPELLTSLAGLHAAHPFARSWGSEVVGAVEDADTVVDAVLLALRQGERARPRFSVGVGVGTVMPDAGGRGELTGTGPARARRAVERCGRAPVPVAVEAGPAGVGFEGVPTAPESAAGAEAVLRLVGDLVVQRSEAEWSVLDLLIPGMRGQQKAVAAELGITVQAVSQAISRARWKQEQEGRNAASLLLGLAAFAVD